jgi:hypothetical protein
MVSVDEELAAELLERAERDQAVRMSLTPGHEMAEWAALVAPVDRDNTARLREIVAAHGWPGRQLAGEAGAHAAWLLVQHAPPDLQEECLSLLEDAVARGDASPVDLAYLTDRVLMHRGDPQVYGTQYRVRDGIPELWTVRDPAGLDERRAALGLEPEAENRARLLARRAPKPDQERLAPRDWSPGRRRIGDRQRFCHGWSGRMSTMRTDLDSRRVTGRRVEDGRGPVRHFAVRHRRGRWLSRGPSFDPYHLGLRVRAGTWSRARAREPPPVHRWRRGPV